MRVPHSDLVVVLVVPLIAGVAVSRARAAHRGEHVGHELGEGHTEDGPGRQGGQERGDGARDEVESEARTVVDDPGHVLDWLGELIILQQASQLFN